ncbi:MAG: hypothetical protein KC496_06085, partial [Anaerolineae bacterium]|nr:hypothetical protein [Anaerolineae bacterium]
MSDVIAWIHADNLNPKQPIFTEMADIPAIFVWDDELLQQWRVSFKRIVFIYECLLELPVVIRRGNVAQEVATFAQEHNAALVLTPDSPSPRHRQICRQILRKMPDRSKISVVHDDPFVAIENQDLDLKRFSRYWRQVQQEALRPTRT